MSSISTSTPAKELRRLLAGAVTSGSFTEADLALAQGLLLSLDSEVSTRLEQCRRETRRATIRYLRSVMSDYDRGVKRVRKQTAGSSSS